MIIGRDLMQDLGMDVRFSDETIAWSGAEVPFCDATSSEASLYYIGESEDDEATSRLRKILDAKYEPAN